MAGPGQNTSRPKEKQFGSDERRTFALFCFFGGGASWFCASICWMEIPIYQQRLGAGYICASVSTKLLDATLLESTNFRGYRLSREAPGATQTRKERLKEGKALAFGKTRSRHEGHFRAGDTSDSSSRTDSNSATTSAPSRPRSSSRSAAPAPETR